MFGIYNRRQIIFAVTGQTAVIGGRTITFIANDMVVAALLINGSLPQLPLAGAIIGDIVFHNRAVGRPAARQQAALGITILILGFGIGFALKLAHKTGAFLIGGGTLGISQIAGRAIAIITNVLFQGLSVGITGFNIYALHPVKRAGIFRVKQRAVRRTSLFIAFKLGIAVISTNFSDTDCGIRRNCSVSGRTSAFITNLPVGNAYGCRRSIFAYFWTTVGSIYNRTGCRVNTTIFSAGFIIGFTLFLNLTTVSAAGFALAAD